MEAILMEMLFNTLYLFKQSEEELLSKRKKPPTVNTEGQPSALTTLGVRGKRMGVERRAQRENKTQTVRRPWFNDMQQHHRQKKWEEVMISTLW